MHLPVIILMGVSGSGKSTLGTAIAAEWGTVFFDGDTFQPPSATAAGSIIWAAIVA